MALVIQHYSLGLQVPTPPCISRDYLVMTIIPWIHGLRVIGPGGLLHLCEYVHTKSEMITVMPHYHRCNLRTIPAESRSYHSGE